jgi:hypothetical protein
MPRILPFSSGCCSKTSVSGQLLIAERTSDFAGGIRKALFSGYPFVFIHPQIFEQALAV